MNKRDKLYRSGCLGIMKGIINKSIKNEKFISFLEKYLVALIVFFSFLFMLFTIKTPFIAINNFDTFMISIITVVMTFISTLITSITIIIVLVDTKSIKAINKNNLWKRFVNFSIFPIIYGIILSMILLYVSFSSKVSFDKIFFILVVSLFILFMLSIFRIGFLLVYILKNIFISDNDNNKPREISNEDLEKIFKP